MIFLWDLKKVIIKIENPDPPKTFEYEISIAHLLKSWRETRLKNVKKTMKKIYMEKFEIFPKKTKYEKIEKNVIFCPKTKNRVSGHNT